MLDPERMNYLCYTNRYTPWMETKQVFYEADSYSSDIEPL